MRYHSITNWIALGTMVCLFFLLAYNTAWWEDGLRWFFQDKQQVLHPRATPLVLICEHIQLVAISSCITIAVGVPVGIWVTRTSGREFQPLLSDFTSLGQTFPPVAVLAIAVPMMGFGLWPTVIALFLYGLMPVIRNTIAGLNAVPVHLKDVALGMGMTRLQVLFRIEIPLSAGIILAGIRTSVIINIGTAMVGAVIGAGGLGSPIVAGLVQDNIAFILEGAIPAAILALLADYFMSNIEHIFMYEID